MRIASYVAFFCALCEAKRLSKNTEVIKSSLLKSTDLFFLFICMFCENSYIAHDTPVFVS